MTDHKAPSLPPVEAQLRHLREKSFLTKDWDTRFEINRLGNPMYLQAVLLADVEAVIAAIPSPQTWQQEIVSVLREPIPDAAKEHTR